MRAKVNLKNIIAYIVGNLRYRLYYSRYKLLIRKHVREQIDMRIKFMKKECYENGTCIICGCATTALQMANKQCDAPCYPPMLSKEIWGKFQNGLIIKEPSHVDKVWVMKPSGKLDLINIAMNQPTRGVYFKYQHTEQNF